MGYLSTCSWSKRTYLYFLFLIEFCSVSLLHSGQIGLHCNTVCTKNTVTSSLFNNAFPDAEIRGFFVSNTDYSLYPNAQNCENHIEIAFCFGGLALSDFLAAFNAGFHFPNAE